MNNFKTIITLFIVLLTTSLSFPEGSANFMLTIYGSKDSTPTKISINFPDDLMITSPNGEVWQTRLEGTWSAEIPYSWYRPLSKTIWGTYPFTGPAILNNTKPNTYNLTLYDNTDKNIFKTTIVFRYDDYVNSVFLDSRELTKNRITLKSLLNLPFGQNPYDISSKLGGHYQYNKSNKEDQDLNMFTDDDEFFMNLFGFEPANVVIEKS